MKLHSEGKIILICFAARREMSFKIYQKIFKRESLPICDNEYGVRKACSFVWRLKKKIRGLLYSFNDREENDLLKLKIT